MLLFLFFMLLETRDQDERLEEWIPPALLLYAALHPVPGSTHRSRTTDAGPVNQARAVQAHRPAQAVHH